MKTRIVCVLLVVVGIVVYRVFGYYAFHPKERFAETATYAFVGYMLAVPITLYFLKGERHWRGVVFTLWFLVVALFVFTMFTMD